MRADQLDRFLAEVGGTRVASLAELGRACDVVLFILPTSAIVEKVLFAPDGVAGALRPGAVVIDMTSGVPDETVRFAEKLAEQGVTFFDAPVSGGVPRARTGQLTIMTGGDAAAIDAAMPILESMGSVIRTGKTGSGHAMKALNNLVSAGGFLIGIEALLIGAKFGIDAGTMVDILNVSTGVNNSTQKKFKQYVLSRSFNSGFPIELMVKDLSAGGGALGRGQHAAVQPVPRTMGRCVHHAWAARRPHRRGSVEREARRPRAARQGLIVPPARKAGPEYLRTGMIPRRRPAMAKMPNEPGSSP